VPGKRANEIAVCVEAENFEARHAARTQAMPVIFDRALLGRVAHSVPPGYNQ
jgi:hypothetical protein